MTSATIVKLVLTLAFSFFLLSACTHEEHNRSFLGSPRGTHSFSNAESIRPFSARFDFLVDLVGKQIKGSVVWEIQFRDTTTDRLILDIGRQPVSRVTNIHQDGSRHDVKFQRGTITGNGRFNDGGYDTILGQALVVPVTRIVRAVEIDFVTSPTSPGVMFIYPNQTAGGREPMMLTVSEPIGARHIFPCADIPDNRFTYTARIKTDRNLIALMSASNNPKGKSANGVYEISMSVPIPTYLWSLAVGDFAFETMSGLCGVYAERQQVGQAAWEFADLDAFIKTAESIFGPFPWQRQDILVLPAIGFAYSAMENPCLIYVSSYMLAGDRSFNYILAHELAHIFHTNVCCHRSWIDLPIVNEGLTEYLRLAIMERNNGILFARSQVWLDYEDLLDVAKTNSHFVLYERHLEDPDQSFNPKSYHKGMFFWMFIENIVGGRDTLLQRLNTIRRSRKFGTISTEELLSEVIGRKTRVEDFSAWLLQDTISFHLNEPQQLSQIRTKLEAWKRGGTLQRTEIRQWTFPEFKYFLTLLTEDSVDTNRGTQLLDTIIAPNMNRSNSMLNSQVLRLYVRYRALKAHKEEILEFLVDRSTLRLIRPLYEELVQTPEGYMIAQDAFELGKARYAAGTIKEIKRVLEKAKPNEK